MKKLGGLLLTIALSTTILAGCQDQRGDLINQAKVAYSQGKVEKAFELFKSANILAPIGSDKKDGNAQTVFLEVQKNAYLLFVKNGDNETTKKDFKKAKEEYEKAVAMAPDQVSEDLQTKLDNVENLEIEQSKIDDYSAFLNGIIKDSNILLRNYNTALATAILDPSKTPEFKSEVKTLVSQSNNIMADMDDAYANIEDDLSTVHDSLIDMVSMQQELLTNSLVVQSDENGTIQEKLQGLQQDVISIKRQQNTVISEMKQYAEDKGVFYDTKKTKIDDTKDQTTAQPANTANTVQQNAATK